MYLLDTHTLLWFLFRQDELSDKVKDIIQTSNGLYVSVVSFWEIAIKQSIGKLNIRKTIVQIEEICREQDISILSIKSDHCDKLKSLPQIHGDPFDRLLIAQSMIEGLKILSKDNKIKCYDIETIW